MRHDIMVCPSCGYEMDTSFAPENKDAQLSPGDVSLCARCTSINVVKEDMELRQVTKEEMEGMREQTPSFYERLIKYKSILLGVKDPI